MGEEIEPEEERVNPSVLMASLLDEANEHLVKLQSQTEINHEQILKEVISEHKEIVAEHRDLVKAVTLLTDIVTPYEKHIPFNTGKQTIATATTRRPSDISGYTVVVDVYNNNKQHPIENMMLSNEGPGTISFVVIGEKPVESSTNEEFLNVGDIRPLHKVYEVRLRTNIPQTAFRLVEGEIRTGSFASAYKANIEIRPTVQLNEKAKDFSLYMDASPPLIPIVPPLPATYLGPSFTAPLAAGITRQFVDIETGLQMPFIVPQGYILEAFAVIWNFTTNSTLRAYFELAPLTGIYNLAFVLPISGRTPPNLVLNINPISTAIVDPNGAPVGGRGILFTITNDDAAAAMIGEIDIIMILRQLA